MSSFAIRLQEIDDGELEEFIELWIERKSQQYVRVERIGAANDKGRDVIGFSSERRHEGPWDLYQCKRKTRNRKLGLPEATTELGKLFHHHVAGAYRTLPISYVFVAARGIVGPLRDLILNPSMLGPYLIAHWDQSVIFDDGLGNNWGTIAGRNRPRGPTQYYAIRAGGGALHRHQSAIF